MDDRSKIREYLAGVLKKRGDTKPFSDGEQLLVSARIDSLDVVEMVSFLETAFGVDFGAQEFDQSVFESVDSLTAFVASGRA